MIALLTNSLLNYTQILVLKNPNLFLKDHCSIVYILNLTNNFIKFLFLYLLASEEPPTKKKKRSRWGGEESRTVIPGMPTVIPPNMSEMQQKLYLSK